MKTVCRDERKCYVIPKCFLSNERKLFFYSLLHFARFESPAWCNDEVGWGGGGKAFDMDIFSEAGDKLGNQRSVFVDVHRKEIFGMLGIFLSTDSSFENLKRV